jgi:hypothetical protein
MYPSTSKYKILNLKFGKWGGTSTMLKFTGHNTLKTSPAHTTNARFFPEPGIFILQRPVDKFSQLTYHTPNPKLFPKET